MNDERQIFNESFTDYIVFGKEIPKDIAKRIWDKLETLYEWEIEEEKRLKADYEELKDDYDTIDKELAEASNKIEEIKGEIWKIWNSI